MRLTWKRSMCHLKALGLFTWIAYLDLWRVRYLLWNMFSKELRRETVRGYYREKIGFEKKCFFIQKLGS